MEVFKLKDMELGELNKGSSTSKIELKEKEPSKEKSPSEEKPLEEKEKETKAIPSSSEELTTSKSNEKEAIQSIEQTSSEKGPVPSKSTEFKLPDEATNGENHPTKVGLHRFQKAAQKVKLPQSVVIAFKLPRAAELPMPRKWYQRIFYVIAWPINKLFYFTVLDCRRERFRKLYPITFITSLIWIAILAHFLVSWATYIGCFLAIPDAIMGLTIIAAGASVPEIISSIAVSKQGLGDMVIANSIGSNIFDILIGLGFPWLLYSAIRGPISIDPTGLAIYIAIALFSVILMFCIFLLQKWRLNKRTGFILSGYYLLFLIFGVLVTYPVGNPVINMINLVIEIPSIA